MSEELKPGKRLIPWRVSNCGGPAIHGTNQCIFDDNTGLTSRCFCNPIPNSNYFLKYTLVALLVEAKSWEFNTQDWDRFSATILQKKSQFQGYNAPGGQQLKKQQTAFVADFVARHDYGPNAKGFETHPAMSNYDRLVKELADGIFKQQAIEDDKKLLKLAKAEKAETLLFVSTNVLPAPPNDVLLTKAGKIPSCIPVPQKKRMREEPQQIDLQEAASGLLSLNATVQALDTTFSPIRSLGAVNEVTPDPITPNEPHAPVPFPFELHRPEDEIAASVQSEVTSSTKKQKGAAFLYSQKVNADREERLQIINRLVAKAKDQEAETSETLKAVLQQSNALMQATNVVMTALTELLKKKDT